jgi:hypothetical protein
MVGKDHSRKKPRQAEKRPEAERSAFTPLADHFAVHDRPPGTPAPEAELLLEEGSVAVFRGTPDDRTRGRARLGPVYRSASGRLSVPTGRVLLRFRDGVSAESRRQEIEAAGYQIEEVLPYAAHAAWVRRASGGISESVAGAETLRKLADVEQVEPQLLSQSVPRGVPKRGE